MQNGVALRERLGERVCVLWWMNLTTCDVCTSSKEFICQIHVRKINCFVDDGLDVRVRCGEKDNYKYKNKNIVQSLTSGGPTTCMSSGQKV